MSLLPGVSGKRYAGIAENKDPWQNSGFGLYIANRICGLGGSFSIFSYDSGLLIENSEKSEISGWHHGTLVRMVIKFDNIPDVKKMMNRFITQGELEATNYMAGANIKPSKASKNLSMYNKKN